MYFYQYLLALVSAYTKQLNISPPLKISNRYDMINKKQLEGFFESKLFKRLSNAKRIWREQRFNIFLPAYEFTENKEKAELLKDETVAVQGVIDIFFEDADGKIVLCDYKTDYLTREEILNPKIAAEKLNKRHAEQLSYYAKAIKEMRFLFFI